MDGRQHVVFPCGGGKNGAPSGGTYVVFALPECGSAIHFLSKNMDPHDWEGNNERLASHRIGPIIVKAD